MWRVVQVWEGVDTPIGAPLRDAAAGLHWRALVGWNRLLIDAGAVPPWPWSTGGSRVTLDAGSPAMADAVHVFRTRRAHPTALAAYEAASSPRPASVAPPPDLGENPARIRYVWEGASSRHGAELVGAALSLCLAALAAWDERLHRAALLRGTPIPSIYDSGVRYAREPFPAEEFLDAVAIRRRGVFDCEDGACDRVGELRARGLEACPEWARRLVPRVVSSGEPPSLVTLFHIVPKGPWGLEDPSRALGMLTE